MAHLSDLGRGSMLMVDFLHVFTRIVDHDDSLVARNLRRRAATVFIAAEFVARALPRTTILHLRGLLWRHRDVGVHRATPTTVVHCVLRNH